MAITDLLEDFEAEDDITACIEDIQKLRIRVDAFKGTAMVGTDDSLKSSATDFRQRTRTLLSKVRIRTTTSPSSPATVTPVHSAPTAPKFKPPIFSGKILEWAAFWNLFSAVMNNNLGLTSSQRTMHLLNAMGSEESKKVATEGAGTELDYDAAVDALKECFERKRTIFAKYFQSWSNTKQIPCKYNNISDAILQMNADIRALERCDAYSCSHMSAAIMERRLDDRLRQRWNVYASDLKIPPTWEYLMEFLKHQLPGLPLEESSKSTSNSQLTTTPKIKAPVLRAEDSRPSSCPVCKGPAHPLFQCETFKSWDQPRRHQHVKTHHQCYNCLGRSHSTRDFPSQCFCRTCGGRHHTLLHRLNNPASAPPANTTGQPNQESISRVQQSTPSSLLSTALVKASRGCYYKVAWALMDPEATVSLVTSRVVQDLRLPKIPHEIILTGLGGERRSRHYIEIRLSSIWNDADDDYLTVRCQVVDTLLPVGECSDAKKIKNMTLVQGKEPLADPTFGCSSRIDLLLGVGDVARAYRDERVHSPDRSIQMDLTVLGGQLVDRFNLALEMKLSCVLLRRQLTPYLRNYGKGKKFLMRKQFNTT